VVPVPHIADMRDSLRPEIISGLFFYSALQQLASIVVGKADSLSNLRKQEKPKMKRLSVVVAGTGQIRDVEIQPGTTAGDVLNQLNLKDYLLSEGPDKPFFAAAESIYDKLRDGEKIFASTKAEVGELMLCA